MHFFRNRNVSIYIINNTEIAVNVVNFTIMTIKNDFFRLNYMKMSDINLFFHLIETFFLLKICTKTIILRKSQKELPRQLLYLLV
ncbi:hypothetical protein BC351_28495 [Paenibacillus ferrarius]|uniref:Uncharacterized protein n=1 Tax=Paenibacillus ferrarius TaxID=1469647 RepID=A0A1V4HJ68_9BACL|nr:hypothetical protein BC351_28495 [Paenibacillus ferrarius]